MSLWTSHYFYRRVWELGIPVNILSWGNNYPVQRDFTTDSQRLRSTTIFCSIQHAMFQNVVRKLKYLQLFPSHGILSFQLQAMCKHIYMGFYSGYVTTMNWINVAWRPLLSEKISKLHNSTLKQQKAQKCTKTTFLHLDETLTLPERHRTNRMSEIMNWSTSFKKKVFISLLRQHVDRFRNGTQRSQASSNLQLCLFPELLLLLLDLLQPCRKVNIFSIRRIFFVIFLVCCSCNEPLHF